MLLYLLDHRAFRVDIRGFLRSEWCEEQLALLFQTALHGGEKTHGQRRGLGEHEIVLDLEGLGDKRYDGFVRFALELQADRLELLALLDKLAHDVAEIHIVVVQSLVHCDVRIPCYPENTPGHNLEILEHHLGITADKLLGQQEFPGARQPYQPGEVFGSRQYPEGGLSCIVLLADSYADVDLAVLKEGHGVLFVHHSGEQQRLYFPGEECAVECVLLR